MTNDSPHNPTSSQALGRVRKYHSNLYHVESGGTLYQCTLRGLMKKEGSEVLTGDRVVLDSIEASNHTARIIRIEPRANLLTRPKMANVDQVVVVHPLREPDFDYEQLDRYLTHVALAGLKAVICISKTDLGDDDGEPGQIKAIYRERLGFDLVFTSIHDPKSLKEFLKLVTGKVSVLAGVSGAGKSSLLNCLNPQLKLKVAEVSEKISRGQHTTRHVELLEIKPGVDIADTPGFSNLKFDYVLPRQIEAIYPDFAENREDCGFSDCLHLDEIGCYVRPKMVDGLLDSRYRSYRAMINEAFIYEDMIQTTSQKEAYGYKTLHRKGKKKDLQILRLDEKAREASRRKTKQQVTALLDDALETPDEDL